MREKVIIILLIFFLQSVNACCDDAQIHFFESLKNQDITGVLQAISNGADIDLKNEYGMPPITFTAAVNNIELVKMLIENDVDINAQNSEGATALHYAVGFNNNAIVDVLVDNAANVNIHLYPV